MILENQSDYILDDLYNKIHDLYPSLNENTDYKLYWFYNENEIYLIKDYMSFITSLILPYRRIIYLLLNDYIDPWFDNINYLKKLDRIELREKMKRERDIYDVKIKRPGDESDNNDDDDENQDFNYDNFFDNIEPEEKRTDIDIIKFALRNMPKMKLYTWEQQITKEYIRVITKGMFGVSRNEILQPQKKTKCKVFMQNYSQPKLICLV